MLSTNLSQAIPSELMNDAPKQINLPQCILSTNKGMKTVCKSGMPVTAVSMIKDVF